MLADERPQALSQSHQIHRQFPQATLTVIDRPLGTERYMAPELRNGIDYSVKSDIFALGVLLEEDLNLTEALEPIWKKCTDRRPAYRYNNIQEIIDDLDKQRNK